MTGGVKLLRKILVIKELTLREKKRQVGIYFKLDGPKELDDTFEIRVSYQLGGHNWWTYKNEPRGIFLGCTPMKIGYNDEGDIKMTSYTAFTGSKLLVRELKRYSLKALEEEALYHFGHDGLFVNWSQLAKDTLKQVCIKNNIEYAHGESGLYGEN